VFQFTSAEGCLCPRGQEEDGCNGASSHGADRWSEPMFSAGICTSPAELTRSELQVIDGVRSPRGLLLLLEASFRESLPSELEF
jgi:hypothetical protein